MVESLSSFSFSFPPCFPPQSFTYVKQVNFQYFIIFSVAILWTSYYRHQSEREASNGLVALLDLEPHHHHYHHNDDRHHDDLIMIIIILRQEAQLQMGQCLCWILSRRLTSWHRHQSWEAKILSKGQYFIISIKTSQVDIDINHRKQRPCWKVNISL